jgi:signal peptide peptidase SppA
MKYHGLIQAFASELWALEDDAFLRAWEIMSAGLRGEDIEARITKQTERDVARREGAVAVLPLHGVISNRRDLFAELFGDGTSAEGFSMAFRTAVAHQGIKAIVLDVNSPGGTVSGTEELSSLIHSARGSKPIVAHVNSMAASAAYWIASAADEMVVTPSGSVGSVGVIAAHNDISGLLARVGVKPTLITAGKYKGEGNPFEPLTDEAREHLQTRVDAAHQAFVKALARNRGVSQAVVEKSFGQGRLVDAPLAMHAGMADSIGTLDSVLSRFGATTAPAEKRRAFAFEREKRALTL